MDNYQKYVEYCWLKVISARPRKLYAEFTDYFGSVHDAWLKFSNEDDKMVEAIGFSASSEKLCNPKYRDAAKRTVEEALSKNIGIVAFDDADYPVRMREYDNMPILLYYEGNLKPAINPEHAISVVGARNCTVLGREITDKLISPLKESQTVVISGMARGIDYCAHKAALSNDLFTVAVLGCGTDVIYPAENAAIYRKIKETGLILSEQPPGTKPFKSYFPARDRIIAALSDCVLVTEAGITSGALITADFAVEYGLDVLCVPHSVDSQFGAGCNQKIKEGAGCVTCASDILLALNVSENGNSKPSLDRNVLGDNEKSILSLIEKRGKIYEDDISQLLNFEVYIVKRSLAALEIYGFIKRRDNGEILANI